MYWVNRGEKSRTAIETAGMDGSDRHLLTVVTAEEPVGLTLDYVTSRLYWISGYKKVGSFNCPAEQQHQCCSTFRLTYLCGTSIYWIDI